MKIKKVQQITPINGEIVNESSNSQNKAYSCEYINENFTPSEIELGTVLYDDTTGDTNITLSDSVNNYDYIQVYFVTNGDLTLINSSIINNFNNAQTIKSYLICGAPANNSTVASWMAFAEVQVTGTSMQLTDQRGTDLYVSSVSSGAGDKIKIVKVIGYKNTIPAITQREGEVYSTEEVKIGTWINGKPLYRKVIDLGTNITISKTDFSLDVTKKPDNMQDPIQSRLFLVNSGNNSTQCLPCKIRNDNETFKCMALDSFSASNTLQVYLILEYTKTTD